ncbi:MAG: alkaline phosphatase family protein [Pseudomonadota bacterium]
MVRRLFIYSIVSIAIFAYALSAHAQKQKIKDVYVIHFIIDGTNKEAFNSALTQGKLPIVQKLFVENGATFSHSLSAFPTTSTSVYQSYTSGLWPGHAGIPHLERFDRQHEKVIGYLTVGGYKQINDDLINLRALTNPDVVEIAPPTTIFELLQGYPTAAVYSPFSRGAAERYPETAPINALWSTYVAEHIENVDVLAMKKVMDLFDRSADQIPRYTLVGLYSSDIMGHKYGPHSKEVAFVLEQFDVFLNDFLKLLAKRNIADKTYIIISADHGMHETGKLFRLRDALKKRGILLKSSPPPNKGYALYAASRGVVSSHAYVRHDGGFEPIDDPDVLRKVPTTDGNTVDLIEFISKLDATDLIIVRAGERRARIFDRDGKWADIACYTIALTDYCSHIRGDGSGDPLGYASNPKIKPLLNGLPHSTFAWRQATADEEYPDAVINLSQIFHDGRAGDIFITTRGRYGFRKVKKGNHGGPKDVDMRTPLLIAGPTVPHGTFGIARPPDIFALLIEWFGINEPKANHDGMNPFEPYDGDDAQLNKLAALEQSGAAVCCKNDRALLKLAREELARRNNLVQKLSVLLDKLDVEKKTGKADARYIDDHIALVKRTLKWAIEGKERMERVKAAL